MLGCMNGGVVKKISIILSGLLFALAFAAPVFCAGRITMYLEDAAHFQGDFDEIRKRGILRIVVPANIGGGRYLPRNGSPVSEQQEIAESFARYHNLTPVLVTVRNFGEMISSLVSGQGDIAVGNLTVTDARRKKISFSVPLAHVREKILVRRDDDRIKSVADLQGKRVMVSQYSTFWDALKWLKKKKYPDIILLPRPPDMLDEEELDLLVQGKIDATIRDSNIVEMYQGYRDDFKVALNFSKQRDIAWGVRKNAPQLLHALNRYLLLEHVLEDNRQPRRDDFDVIKQRKVLRVLLRNNASSYFLYKGELLGFEYEMVRAFARFHKLRLEVIVPPTYRELLQWLVDGRADLAVGFLEPTPRRKAMGIAFSLPYNEEYQHLVVNRKDPLKSLQELGDRVVSVRASSAYWETLKNLEKMGIKINLKAAPEDMETEELIRQVGAKKLDSTLADEHILDIELVKLTPVRSAFTIGEKRRQAVAIRQNNPKLLAAINAFIKKNLGSEFYNVLYNKYFKSRKSIRQLSKGRIENIGENKLSPWDDIVKKYADKYGFDWRLVTAQIYQESRFNPNIKSFAGAIGLMQLMPRTARSVGVKNIRQPEHNIEGGIRYLDWLRDRFNADMPVSEKIWFTLAAYNAGVGHVKDAQRLARKLGLDPSRWFDNVEKAMLLLAHKNYYQKARYGYVDGNETVKYVREIKARYEAYSSLKQTVAIN